MIEQPLHEKCVIELLKYIGEDPTREGLLETPKRHAKFLHQFFNPEPFNFTTFTPETKDGDMVIVKDIPFYSMCEHHLVPFFGTGHIAYIPTAKMVGLSKIPRLLDKHARRPQNQERITRGVAEELMLELAPLGVAVVLEARHLCVEMRGVEKPGTITKTSCMLGVFKEDASCRAEFLNLIK